MDYMELLRVIHLIGMAFGVGGGFVADTLMAKAVLTNTVDSQQVKTMQHVGSIVTIGLILLTLTGAGFLTAYVIESPELLLNPKLWAKVSVVAILAMNGYVLHKVTLPFLESRISKPLFTKDTSKQAHLTMSVGAISVTSWYTALVLGAWAGLNFAASYWAIFGVYGVVLAIALLVANVTAWRFAAAESKQRPKNSKNRLAVRQRAA